MILPLLMPWLLTTTSLSSLVSFVSRNTHLRVSDGDAVEVLSSSEQSNSIMEIIVGLVKQSPERHAFWL